MSPRIARRLAVASVVGFLCLGIGCSSDEQKLARHMSSAEQYAAEGKRKEALIELRNALQLAPRNADVNFRISRLLEEDGKLAEAVFFLRETTRLDPSRTDAAMAEAKLIMFDDPERAEELIEQVIETDPANTLAYVRRSEIALARNDTEGALAAALTATELQPKDGMGWMQLGITNLARIREARLESREPDQDVFEGAEKAFRRADELFGGGAQARVELGRLYAAWPGHAPEAGATYRSAVEVARPGEPRGRVAGAAASYARTVEDVELLRWALEEIVQNVPESLSSWDQLAELEEQREAGGGEQVYERLIGLRPEDAQARVRRARFLARHERFDDAIARLEKQADEGPEPPVALEEIVALRLARGELEPARAATRRLTADYGSHARTALATGRLALAERRNDEAAEALRRYAGSEESVEGQRLLALAELGRGNHPASVAAVDRALQLEGESPAELLRLKASIHQAAGDWPQALLTMNRLARTPGIESRRSDELLYARALYETGRAPLGKQVLERMLQASDPPLQVYVEYATRERQAEPERAREYLEKVLAEAPRHEGALRLLIARDVETGQLPAALARLDQAAATGPLPPTLLLLRAQVLVAQGEHARAEEEARRAFAAAPNLTAALDLLAQIYAVQGRIDEAIASFEEAEQVGALPPSGQVLLARLHLSAGHRKEAQGYYEKALAARDDLPGAKNDLAWILAETGADLDRATTLAQEASRAEPDNADFVDTLGFVYLRKGLDEPALEQFRFAIELSEREARKRPLFHHHMGLALRALGRQGEAATAFARALELDAGFPEADEARREMEAAKSAAAATPG